MADFIETAASKDSGPPPKYLAAWRAAGIESWRRRSLPTRKTEAWKYTNLRPLEKAAYAARPEADGIDEESLRPLIDIPGLGANRLVFVNGTYSDTLSDYDCADGMTVVRFADANGKDAETIAAHIGRLIDGERHLFAALNDGWTEDGVFVRIEDHAIVTTPLHVVWLTTNASHPFGVAQRLLLLAGKDCEASLIEHFVSTEDAQQVFTNGITELHVSANANLKHCRLHLEQPSAAHIGGVHVSLDRDSRLNSFHLGFGGVLKRIDAVVHHRGEGAHCEMNGIYLPRDSQQIDYHTTIEHAVPRCTTSETFRGIIADRGKAVFNGRIHIHPDAQKTDARLSNRNLLTSPDAEVDTKPELEIYADDVQCAHGATVAQLEDDSLFYFMSRGISREEAKVMLSFGFINELVDRVPVPALAEYLRPRLVARFSDPGLSRHIL